MDITWYYKHMKPWQYLVEHKKIINKINNDENVSSLEVDVVQRNLVDNHINKSLEDQILSNVINLMFIC